MREIIVVTKNGEYTTETDWNLDVLAQNLDCSDYSESKRSINIGNYIFKKEDIVMIKPVRE